jgi:hypothetical protein
MTHKGAKITFINRKLLDYSTDLNEVRFSPWGKTMGG